MCRFLDSDGHCAFHSDKEVKEYCVAGPCPDEQSYDELVKALRNCGKASENRCGDCAYYDREPWCEAVLANDAADAIERLVADRNKLKDKLILNICSHCDSRFDYCGECPIIKDINEVFDEQ